MKNLLLAFLIFLSSPLWSQNSQGLGIQAGGGAMFTGYGDYWGNDLNFTVSYEVNKFSVGLVVGKGNVTGSAFSMDALKNLPNLFIGDEYLENFPIQGEGCIACYEGIYNYGAARFAPKTDFSNYEYLRVQAARTFTITRFLDFSLGAFAGIEKITQTSVGLFAGATVKGVGWPEWDGFITSPTLQSFLDFTYGLDFRFGFDVFKGLKLGPYATWSEAQTARWFSMGLKAKYIIK